MEPDPALILQASHPDSPSCLSRCWGALGTLLNEWEFSVLISQYGRSADNFSGVRLIII